MRSHFSLLFVVSVVLLLGCCFFFWSYISLNNLLFLCPHWFCLLSKLYVSLQSQFYSSEQILHTSFENRLVFQLIHIIFTHLSLKKNVAVFTEWQKHRGGTKYCVFVMACSERERARAWERVCLSVGQNILMTDTLLHNLPVFVSLTTKLIFLGGTGRV